MKKSSSSSAQATGAQELAGTRRAALSLALRSAAGLASLGLFGPAVRAATGAEPSDAPASSGAATPATIPPRVRLLTHGEASAALTESAATPYYDSLNLREIRARLGLPLEDVSLPDARLAVRQAYAGKTLSFSGEESAALRAIVERMQPRLAARAPLYARTPWSFIKLDNSAEGGMPHTRGPHIVLPASVADFFAKKHREAHDAGTLASARFGNGLLVHEQTHVLERADPARFEALYTEVFGFTHMNPAPTTPWLSAHVVQNPDAPDVGWAFPLEKIGGSGWVMPAVVLPDVTRPRMPQDFQTVAVPVVQTSAGWKVVEDGDKPPLRDLSAIPGYDTHFPWPDEDFHPNEIAAVLLSHWVLQDAPDLDTRPMVAATGAWARTALA